MNDQNEQQQMPLLEEALLDEVTGGGPPWNHPFDSGTALIAPAAEKVMRSADIGKPIALKDQISALDRINQNAVAGHRMKATITPERKEILPGGKTRLFPSEIILDFAK